MNVLNEDGYYEDDFGNEYGYCNACGEEAPPETTCCLDGEVVPYEGGVS